MDGPFGVMNFLWIHFRIRVVGFDGVCVWI